MKKFKKVMVAALAVTMMVGLAGCKSEKNGGDKAVLEWWYYGNGNQLDTQMVQTKVNELLAAKPGYENTEIHLNSFNSDYPNQVTLGMAAGKQMDILNTYRLNYPELIENGTLIDITELLDKTPELKSTLPDWLWEMVTCEGGIHLVPNYQKATNVCFFVTPAKYIEGYEKRQEFEEIVKHEDEHSLRELASALEDYLLYVRSKNGDTKYLNGFASMIDSDVTFSRFFSKLSGNFVIYNDEDQVSHRLTNDRMKEAYAISAEWYKKGYVPQDILTAANTDTYKAQNMTNPISIIAVGGNSIGDSERVSKALSTSYGFDVVAIPINEGKHFIPNSWNAGGHGITPMCKDPEAALKFLELIYTPEGKEIYNTLVYGIEGKHYEKIGDDLIKTLEYDSAQGGVSTSYAAMKWNMGNAFMAYDNQGCTEDEKKLSLELNESKDNVLSEYIGFYPKFKEIEDELGQIEAIDTEYKETLLSGVKGDDWEQYYKEYENKLKLAGYDKIVENLQKQADEFKKSK